MGTPKTESIQDKNPIQQLQEAGYLVRLYGTTALDIYYRKFESTLIDIETDADLIALSSLFDHIEFTGEERIDAVITGSFPYHVFRNRKQYDIKSDSAASGRKCTYLIRIIDHSDERASIWNPLQLIYYPAERKFVDSADCYQIVRNKELLSSKKSIEHVRLNEFWWYSIADLAELAARYNWNISDDCWEKPDFRKNPNELGEHEQRRLLLKIIESSFPGKGLNILMKSGFIREHWPLLAAMRGVYQDKDFHPEGDVWDHTIEMFKYIKQADARLGMGILLHDCGKAFAAKQNNNEFDKHAQIGAEKSLRFLRQLGFSESFNQSVFYLVSNHMVTAHVPDIPVRSIEHVLDSELFPTLLELFRCDISSTFRDPENYYRACEFFRRYKKNRRNPYRDKSGDLVGKKRYMELYR